MRIVRFFSSLGEDPWPAMAAYAVLFWTLGIAGLLIIGLTGHLDPVVGVLAVPAAMGSGYAFIPSSASFLRATRITSAFALGVSGTLLTVHLGLGSTGTITPEIGLPYPTSLGLVALLSAIGVWTSAWKIARASERESARQHADLLDAIATSARGPARPRSAHRAAAAAVAGLLIGAALARRRPGR